MGGIKFFNPMDNQLAEFDWRNPIFESGSSQGGWNLIFLEGGILVGGWNLSWRAEFWLAGGFWFQHDSDPMAEFGLAEMAFGMI